MKMLYLSIVLLFVLYNANAQKISGELSVIGIECVIEEANLAMKLPNINWQLASKVEGKLVQYFFKRNPIKNKEGMKIIPSIMIFVEDASSYKGDVTMYSIWKRKPFMEKGVKVDKMMVHSSKGYPLTLKNAFFNKCSYKENDLEHILYMIHIINKDNKGVQIYMDMTKDISAEYESEFWTSIKSIKEYSKL